MALGRVVSFLLEHSVKIGAAIVIVAGLVWFLSPGDDPLKVLQTRCKEQKLPIRVVELEPGSLQEDKFLLMVPASNRERTNDRTWGILPGESAHRPARGRTSVKGDDPFRDDDVYQPAEKPASSIRWLATSLRVLILAVAVLAAVAILYGIVQVFICDLREIVFRGMPRRAVWLCR